ncbi:hypothetical protein [Actinomycetospora aeridis]|uniref:Uncharacterized protein n=1 Tax=Actinomycetospora aeridis TaxID=3129231 RepID=A0ABU8N152_9PSEU
MPDTPVPLADALLVVDAVSAYAKAAKTAETEARDRIATDYLTQGDRMTIRDPRTNAKLGTVSITDPQAVAEVDDEEALLDYIAHEHPEAIDWTRTVRPETIGTAVAVLAEHAPELLTPPRRTAADWARAEALKLAADSGEPIPEVAVRMKRGHAMVRHERDSLDRYRELVAAGTVDPLRALPAASVDAGQVA